MNADTPKRKNLGRGLDALFGEQETSSPLGEGVAAPAGATANRVPVEFLAPSPFQPRRHFDESALADLAASVAEKGVLQPLLVRPDSQKPGHFEIIAGERRWRAAQRAQVHEVPVLVIELTDAETLEVALVENLQRQDLSPMEEARGYQRLIGEFHHTQEQVANVVGKSRTNVANALRLLTLPDAVQDMIERGQLSIGQARPLIGRKDAEEIARIVVKKGLSARQTERLSKNFGVSKTAARTGVAALAKDADTAALEQSLAQATGYNVSISFNGKGGAVTIAYATLEQLDDIVRRLSNGPRKAAHGGTDTDMDGTADDMPDQGISGSDIGHAEEI
ncbi:MAG: ParB/RepB/Spo0J family partition protein [Rhodospirillaceae bacterium]|nr:ParB/RepB/Spo0J family partition protein [Rhodospirillaceae bacterium]